MIERIDPNKVKWLEELIPTVLRITYPEMQWGKHLALSNKVFGSLTFASGGQISIQDIDVWPSSRDVEIFKTVAGDLLTPEDEVPYRIALRYEEGDAEKVRQLFLLATLNGWEVVVDSRIGQGQLYFSHDGLCQLIGDAKDADLTELVTGIRNLAKGRAYKIVKGRLRIL